MNWTRKRIIFSCYSYAENVGYLILEICPPFIRNLIFKLLFQRFGRNNLLDYGTYFRYPFRISLGSNLEINRGSCLYPSQRIKEATITIGDNVHLGPEVSVFAAGHDYRFVDFPDIAKPVVIQNNVWIGGKSIILPGVNIGEGSVIGAGSVVVSDIPSYSIAVGNPAKVIKKRTLSS